MRVGAQGSRLSRVVALILVLTIPILATMARRSWYVSSSNHGQYLLNASKAKLAHGSELNSHLPLRTVIVLVTSEPSLRVDWYLQPEFPRFAYLLDPSVSRQFRSPPNSLA